MKQQFKFYVRGSHESAINQIRKLSDFYDKSENSILMNVYADTQPKKGLKQFELEVMLNSLNKGEIILATKPDRISRNIERYLEIVKFVEDVGAEIIFINQEPVEELSKLIVLSMANRFETRLKKNGGENKYEQ